MTSPETAHSTRHASFVVSVMAATGTSATYRAETNSKTVRGSQWQAARGGGVGPFCTAAGLILDRVRFRGPSIPRDDESIHRPSRHGLVGHHRSGNQPPPLQPAPPGPYAAANHDQTGGYEGLGATLQDSSQGLSRISISCVEQQRALVFV